MIIIIMIKVKFRIIIILDIFMLKAIKEINVLEVYNSQWILFLFHCCDLPHSNRKINRQKIVPFLFLINL